MAYIKPRPNERNMSMQHIAIHSRPQSLRFFWSRGRRQRHFKTSSTGDENDRNIVGYNMLGAFGHPVAKCWVLLAQI